MNRRDDKSPIVFSSTTTAKKHKLLLVQKKITIEYFKIQIHPPFHPPCPVVPLCVSLAEARKDADQQESVESPE